MCLVQHEWMGANADCEYLMTRKRFNWFSIRTLFKWGLRAGINAKLASWSYRMKSPVHWNFLFLFLFVLAVPISFTQTMKLEFFLSRQRIWIWQIQQKTKGKKWNFSMLSTRVIEPNRIDSIRFDAMGTMTLTTLYRRTNGRYRYDDDVSDTHNTIRDRNEIKPIQPDAINIDRKLLYQFSANTCHIEISLLANKFRSHRTLYAQRTHIFGLSCPYFFLSFFSFSPAFVSASGAFRMLLLLLLLSYSSWHCFDLFSVAIVMM